jgi:hypothetical protein
MGQNKIGSVKILCAFFVSRNSSQGQEILLSVSKFLLVRDIFHNISHDYGSQFIENNKCYCLYSSSKFCLCSALNVT